MLKRAAAVFLVCVGIATWIACGSTSSHYVYATIPAANQVQVYREDPNSGVLTALTGSPFTAGLAARSIVVHPSKKFLYVANSGESDLSAGHGFSGEFSVCGQRGYE
jgi:6-phosphogluconolactonase (cycloisomerase 2 family)